MARVSVLNLKALRTAEYRRKLFYSNFEHEREKRNSLYERLKPRLNIKSRNLIERKKIELKMKMKKPRSFDLKRQKRKSSTPGNLSDGSLGGSNNIDDFLTSFDNDDNGDDNKPAISSRSSLKSSLIESAKNESFDSENTDILQR